MFSGFLTDRVFVTMQQQEMLTDQYSQLSDSPCEI